MTVPAVARDVDNMLKAGRCISGDCVATGEVAGRAAAIASRDGCVAGEVAAQDVAVLPD